MNDYMFHRVMERNQNVLRGLLCALLHLNPEDILSLEILNPIGLGKAAGDNDYVEVKPACHIGILDFTLFPEQAEFYASYKLLNENNHREYSDKFTLRVLDLTQIQMATEEDKAYGLDRWAKLFKATTWEEFKMIAADDKIMQEAGETVFKLNWTDSERYMCEARRSWNTLNKLLSNAEAELAEKNAIIAERDSIIVEKDSTIAELEATIASLKGNVK